MRRKDLNNVARRIEKDKRVKVERDEARRVKRIIIRHSLDKGSK